jgi:hypothetical protein
MAYIAETSDIRLNRDKFGRLSLTTHCCKCNRAGYVHIKNVAQAHVPEFIEKKLRTFGWVPGRRRADDVCFTCNHAERQKEPKVQPASVEDIERALDQIIQSSNKENTEVLDQVKEKVRKKTVRLTRLEEHQIISLLEKHITKLDGGFVEYKDNLNDNGMVSLLNNPRINSDHIKNIRQDCFGKLRSRMPFKGGVTKYEVLTKRIDELERIVLELMSK